VKNNPLEPDTSLLVKLGSIAVHIEEAMSAKGHHFDLVALRQLVSDPEVKAWLREMDKMALVPRKR